MDTAFYIAGIIAIISAVAVITRRHAVHALLYLTVTLLALAVAMYALGAHLAAALEVIVYAGAVLVLFVFVIMMLDVRAASRPYGVRLSRPGTWLGPLLLAAGLLAEMIYVLWASPEPAPPIQTVGAKQVGMALFGPYLVGVELASMILLAGLVAAYHLARRSMGASPVDPAETHDRQGHNEKED